VIYTKYYFSIYPEFEGVFSVQLGLNSEKQLVTFPDGGVYGIKINADKTFQGTYKFPSAAEVKLGGKIDANSAGYSLLRFNNDGKQTPLGER